MSNTSKNESPIMPGEMVWSVSVDFKYPYYSEVACVSYFENGVAEFELYKDKRAGTITSTRIAFRTKEELISALLSHVESLSEQMDKIEYVVKNGKYAKYEKYLGQ